MTQKDYKVLQLLDPIAFADAIKSELEVPPSKLMDANGNKLPETFDGVAEKTLRSVAQRLLDVLKRDNPRFDAERFTKACGF